MLASCLTLLLAAMGWTASAQPTPSLVRAISNAPKDAEDDIAKKLANPIANMVSVPFQWNYDRGRGLNESGSDNTLLFQPVIPISFSGGNTLIVRPIVQTTWLNNVNGNSGTGVSNLQLETFYAPSTGSSFIWGVGPYLSSPSISGDKYGSMQTGAGITFVALDQAGPWTYGFLGFQSWSVGGDATYGTQNNFYAQPFLAYVTKDAWTYSLNSQTVYNYDLQKAQVPFNAAVSKLVVTDGMPISYSVGVRYNASSLPGGAQGWGLRASITFVIPEK